MKKTILTLSIIAIIAGTFSTSFGSTPDKKSLKARENLQETRNNVVVTKQDLKKTHKYIVSDYRKFIKDSEIKINGNKKCFNDFKVTLSEINELERSTNQNNVDGLEQQNSNLKQNLVNYKKAKRQNKWAAFKDKFNNEMDKLETQMWSVN